MSRTNRVTATRRVEAPAAAVFGLLSDPSRHPDFDGSGMLRSLLTPGVVTGLGNVFTMGMHNAVMGEYTIDNIVVEFEPERRIAWEPVLSGASRDEDKADIGHNLHHRWGYELEPLEGGATLVTEFFDCSGSPEDWQDELQEDLEGGWVRPAMADSLTKIEDQVTKR